MNATPLFLPDASPGERSLPHYNRLARTVRDWQWFGGEGIALVRLPSGTTVMRLPETKLWAHPWRVTLSGDSASLLQGLCNTEMPHLQGRPMDGLDAKGNPHRDGVPTLPLGKMAEGDAWIVLRAYADEAAKGKLVLPYTIEKAEKRTWGAGYAAAQEGKDGALFGDFPLALLRTDGDGGTRLTQVAHFNIRCKFQAGAGAGKKGRFWFFV